MPESPPKSIRFSQTKRDRVTSLAGLLTGGDFSKCIHQLIDEALDRREMPIPDGTTHRQLEETLLATKRLVPRLHEILLIIASRNTENAYDHFDEIRDEIRSLLASSSQLLAILERFLCKK